MTVVLFVVVACTVAAVMAWQFVEPFDCGVTDCDQRDNPYHGHDIRQKPWRVVQPDEEPRA